MVRQRNERVTTPKMSVRTVPRDETPVCSTGMALRSDATRLRAGVAYPAPVPVASSMLDSLAVRPIPTEGLSDMMRGKKKETLGETKEKKSLLERAKSAAGAVKKAVSDGAKNAASNAKTAYDDKMYKACPGKRRFVFGKIEFGGKTGVVVIVDPKADKRSVESMWTDKLNAAQVKAFGPRAMEQEKERTHKGKDPNSGEDRDMYGAHDRSLGLMMEDMDVAPQVDGATMEAVLTGLKFVNFDGETKEGLLATHAFMVTSIPQDISVSEVLSTALKPVPQKLPVDSRFLDAQYQGIAYPVHKKGENSYVYGHPILMGRDPENRLASYVLHKTQLAPVFETGSDEKHMDLRLAWHARKVNRSLTCIMKYGPPEMRTTLRKVFTADPAKYK